jgi:competence protein ComEA
MRQHAGAADEPPEPSLLQPAPTGLIRTAWQQVLSRVPIRLDPGRRAAAAVGFAVLAAAVITGLWLLAERPRAVAVGDNTSGIASTPNPLGSSLLSPPSQPVTRAAASSAAAVVVDVAGKVRRPGLYRLPGGARIDDAVRAAGGALAGVDLTSLNLAAKVVDGQQILVGLPASSGAPIGSVPGGGSATATGAVTVDLNTATLEQLESLPGVGPVLGQNILDWRTAHGQFTSIDQLQDVTGIGPAKFADLKGLVTL